MNGLSDKDAARLYRKKKNQDYRNKFTKENYDRITILRNKGDKEKIKAIADSKGITTTELINEAIDLWASQNGYKL